MSTIVQSNSSINKGFLPLKVAEAVNDGEAINKGQLLEESISQGLIRKGATISSNVDNEVDSLITDASIFGDTSISLGAVNYRGTILGNLCILTMYINISGFDETPDDSGIKLSLDLLTILKRFDSSIKGTNENMYCTGSIRLFDSDNADYPELPMRVTVASPDDEISFYLGDATDITHSLTHGYITTMVAIQLMY